MNELVSIAEYIENNGTFIMNMTNDKIPEFIRQADFQEELKDYMLMRYGKYKLSQDTKTIPARCDCIYKANNYRYTTLENTTHLEYNPIENYRSEEKSTETNSGTDKTDMERAERSMTNSIGIGNVTTTSQKAPFETENFTNTEKNTVNDTGRTDTNVSESYTDTDNTTYGHIIEHELTRSGNIGVTTSQQMLVSERVDAAPFNIVEIIAKDIIRNICFCVF